MASRNSYRKIITHDGLRKVQEISAATQWELDQKIKDKREQWDKQWQRQCKAENDAEMKSEADARTKEAEDVQSKIDSILLSVSDGRSFDFGCLKRSDVFQEKRPVKQAISPIPRQPDPNDGKYQPEITFSMRLFKSKAEEEKARAKGLFERDMRVWEHKRDALTEKNNSILAAYEAEKGKWQARKNDFLAQREAFNDSIDALVEGFFKADKNGVEELTERMIGCIELPFDYNLKAYSEFSPNDKSLIMEVFFPALEDLPSLKSVSYVKARSELKETSFSESAMKKKYDSFIYQLVLGIVHRAMMAGGDRNPVQSIVLNGRVRTIDKATGKQIEPVVLSLSSTKEAISEINVRTVDAKAWFKGSRGVSAASIATVTPVAPIVQISREDKRFIEGYSVQGELDEGMNLAAMDWQDFENLIREIFEQEFSAPGGEVKITRTSRDGGVDAVAFDPDPIRGGKIVIQAKRYTNTVGVSAVRDLYGTMMNEGAMKGILVTTSNYGNDAYDFIAGKPLTLVNGANLLYLLEKHGHKAKIDLKEAKQALNER